MGQGQDGDGEKGTGKNTTGAPEDVVRTVTENCRTLKFSDYDFEEE